jgi:hypothetical protein
MAVGAFLEPLVVVTLLFGGAYFNRNKDYDLRKGTSGWAGHRNLKRSDDAEDLGSRPSEEWSSSSSTPTLAPQEPRLRRRKLHLFGYTKIVSTPNTLIFKDRFLSRVLQKFPFLAEAWYWANIYWVCPRLHIIPSIYHHEISLLGFPHTF